MFGGAGLYLDGAIFGLVADGEVYLRARDAFADGLAAQGARPFTYEGRGKATQMAYWSLPEAAWDDPEEAAALARRALATHETS